MLTEIIDRDFSSGPVKEYHSLSGVSALPRGIKPSHVSRLVVSVVVDAVKAVLGRGSVSNLANNVVPEFNEIRNPIRENRYPSSAVLKVMLLVFVVAPFFNSRPQVIEVMMRVAIDTKSMGGFYPDDVLFFEASAGLNPEEIGPSDRLFGAAITANREEIPVLVFMGQTHYYKTPESLSNINHKSTLFWHSESRT